jgi:hypothetical protein
MFAFNSGVQTTGSRLESATVVAPLSPEPSLSFPCPFIRPALPQTLSPWLDGRHMLSGQRVSSSRCLRGACYDHLPQHGRLASRRAAMLVRSAFAATVMLAATVNATHSYLR